MMLVINHETSKGSEQGNRRYDALKFRFLEKYRFVSEILKYGRSMNDFYLNFLSSETYTFISNYNVSIVFFEKKILSSNIKNEFLTDFDTSLYLHITI